MFGSQVLDVVVGLVFVYLLLSIICTAANEMIGSLLSLRGRTLAKGITNLLADKQIRGLDELFYDHPLIKSLYRGRKKPSYIPSHTFALAFLDGIAPLEGNGERAIPGIRAAVSELKDDSELKRLLSIFLYQAGDDFTKLQTHIETWFNDSMSRVAGWYKRKSQMITVILALLITGITNADTIQMVSHLSTAPALRAQVVARAQDFIQKHPGMTAQHPGEGPGSINAPISPNAGGGPTPALPLPATPPGSQETPEATLSDLRQTGFPLGWQALPKRQEWPNKIIGLLLSVFAISLGAPFWFDLLNRFAKIRSTGSVPEPTKKE